MPAAHFLGLRPRLVFAQYPDDLLLAEATPFHRPSPFSGDGLYLISAEFSGCRPTPEAKAANFAKALMTVELDTMRNGFRNCIRFMIVRLNEIEQTLLAHKEAHLKARAAQAKKSSDGG